MTRGWWPKGILSLTVHRLPELGNFLTLASKKDIVASEHVLQTPTRSNNATDCSTGNSCNISNDVHLSERDAGKLARDGCYFKKKNNKSCINRKHVNTKQRTASVKRFQVIKVQAWQLAL